VTVEAEAGRIGTCPELNTRSSGAEADVGTFTALRKLIRIVIDKVSIKMEVLSMMMEEARDERAGRQ
jgi:hypothetical protein